MMNETGRSQQELVKRIKEIKSKWGKRLCILGHYYQRPEILAHADILGDSFKLSKEAASRDGCDAIVFCGVHFMAETADILANSPHRLAQRERPVDVLLPNPKAGCPMADMATLHQVENAWNEMAEMIDVSDIAPITYVNSSAGVKSFCGVRHGFACTSSNAKKVLQRAFSEKKRVLFLPDEHLGRNTSLDLGIPQEEILLWYHLNPVMLEETAILEQDGFLPAGTSDALRAKAEKPFGGADPKEIQRAKVILWKGFCPVHQRFKLTDLSRFRDDHPEGRIAVHPECRRDVTAAADDAGSTKKILDLVTAGDAGSVWGIGTERHFVESLRNGYSDRKIYPLSPEEPSCSGMDQISLSDLCRTLESLEEGQPVYRIEVSESIAAGARLALNRMLECE